MSFLDIVKSETKRSESLKSSLFEEKQEIVVNLREYNLKYYEELMITKKFLNDVTYGLNTCQVNERSNRIRIDWFSSLLKFELDNLNKRPKYSMELANSLNFQCQVNQGLGFDDIRASSDEIINNLSISTNMSSSEISLSSMSCSTSSVSSVNVSENSEAVNEV